MLRLRCFGITCAVLLLAFVASTAQAQPGTFGTGETKRKPVAQPIGLVNVSSIDKSLQEIAQMFRITGRSDMMDVVNGFLDNENVRNFPGVDRTRPLGYMFFLGSDLPPRPIPVVYFGVTDEAQVVEQIKAVGGDIAEAGEGVYNLGTSKENYSQLHFRKGYAYLCGDPGSTFLEDYEIPEVETLVGKLSARYDLAGSINLRGIPPLMKQVFATFFSQQSAAQLQQRDHESDASYQARRASGLSTLQAIEQLIRDGEEIIIGVDSTEDGRRAVLEVSIDAAQNSEYAKYLHGIAGAPSAFTPLLREKHPLQISMSWNADSREKTAMLGFLEAFRLEMKGKLNESAQSSVDGLVQTLQATVNNGHIDSVIQFIPVKDKKFVLLAAVKVVGGQALEGHLREFSRGITEANSSVQFDLNLHQHEQVTFSRIRSKPGRNERRIFGEKADVYWGVGNNTLWLGLGGDDMLATFDSAIDSMTAPKTSGNTVTATPFQLIFRALPWLEVTETGKEKGRSLERRELIQSALSPEDDALRVEVRPSDSGVRVTFRFDESFVRLLGSAFADLYDRSQL
ncbi:MAG TPA: hypothetical protein VNQ76_18750 [Planctomicrobium sp.]|nr:hypothetical protein [Planctomicrobium sp.]